MKKIKGKGIFIGKFESDEVKLNKWDGIKRWEEEKGYEGVKVKKWERKMIDMKKE